MDEIVLQQQLAIPTTYENNMTPEVARKVDELKLTIDMHDKNKIVAYGREVQSSIGKFYDSVLQGVGTKDIGEAGEFLTKVISNINGYNAISESESSGGIFGFFKKQKSKVQNLQNKYKPLLTNMDNVVKELQKKDLALTQISHNFDIMYDENRSMYEFLTMAIFAGEQALKEEKEKLALMQEEAQASNDSMEVQKVSDYSNDILRFERRLYDLKVSRTLAIQQAPEIRNIQNSADQLSESIKSCIITSIPLWKSQMVMALGMQVTKDGLNAVNAVKDATNAMLLANSQMNKQLTLETAKAVERGVVDIETINEVNKNLIDSLTASYEIVQKAITEREEGAKQLKANEEALKNTIIKVATR